MTLSIQQTDDLAKALGVPLELLHEIATHPDRHFTPGKTKPKPGKKPRDCTFLSKQASEVLTRINRLFQDHGDHPSYVHGAIRGRTIASNARQHIGTRPLYKLDIRKFFPSVTPAMLKRELAAVTRMSEPVIDLLVQVMTYKGSLITGSPASAVVATLVIRRATNRINGLVQRYGGSFSVFADDISISGSQRIRSIIPQCIAYIEETGVKINPDKTTESRGDHNDRIVTGVDVRGGIDAPSHFKQKVVTNCKRLDRRLREGGTVTDHDRAVLNGQLNHLEQLNPGMAKLYQRRYAHVLTTNKSSPSPF
jgi:RNA-directed DNA polymerase